MKRIILPWVALGALLLLASWAVATTLTHSADRFIDPTYSVYRNSGNPQLDPEYLFAHEVETLIENGTLGPGTYTGGPVVGDVNLADGVCIFSAPEVADGNNAIRAYDVDGTEFTDILRWSNGNTPTVVLGAATVQFSLASTGLDVSTAGAISNATTIQGTGNATMAGYTFGTTGSSLYTAVVDINDAEIVALREKPFTLVAAPGANSYVEVVSCQLIFDYGSGTAYAESDDNLIIGYDDGSTQIGNTLEMTGFINQTADMILPWVNSATARAASLLVNKNVALKNSGDTEIVTGSASDGALRVIVTYRVHTSLGL